MEPIESSETSAYINTLTPGTYPKENKLQSQFIPLQNVVYFITLHFLVLKIFTFYINDVLIFKSPVPGPKVNAVS